MVIPSPPAFKTINLFEKSSPPVIKPIGGIKSIFNERSNDTSEGCTDDDADREVYGVTFDGEFLKFLPHVVHLISDDDIDELFRNDNHIADRLTGDPILNFWVR